jgi:ATP-dependent DNA helicase RecG
VFIEHDPLLRRFFTAFLFEDLPAGDRRADPVYLAEVDHSAIYVGLFGNDYGFKDAWELSPTEQEFDRATGQGKLRLIFVKGMDDRQRHPKMKTLIQKAGSQLIRRRYGNIDELKAALYASLVDYLVTCGIIQDRPFEERAIREATLDDLDDRAVANFVRLARSERQFPLPETAPMAAVLTHLHLLCEVQPTNAALLLFGRDPQRFLPSAEVRCMHFHGTEIQRPVPFYRIFKGNAFEQVDMATDFVMSKLNRSIGTRAESSQAPVRYEILPDVIREAVVNAVAHRDYASAGAVQVSVFADRVEVWNPGVLPEPDFVQRGGEFTITLWRDWLTAELIATLNLNDRQLRAIKHAKTTGRINNAQYREMTGVSESTALRELRQLTTMGIFKKVGGTGQLSHYALVKAKPFAGDQSGNPS